MLNRVADLARAELAAVNGRTHADPHRVESAEERVIERKQKLLNAALALDRVLVDRGDADGRRRLVEPGLRLAATV